MMMWLRSWGESLEYILPMKLFGKAFACWFKKFWWLLVLMTILLFLPGGQIIKQFNIVQIKFQNVFGVLILLVNFPIYFTLYASVIFSARDKKIQGIWKYFFYWLIFNIIISLFFSNYILFFQPCIGIFFAFFFFESIGGIKAAFYSLGKTCKMFFFNLPFCLIFNIIILDIVYQKWLMHLIYRYRITISDLLWIGPGLLKIIVVITPLLFTFLFACILAKFYIQRRQDNPELY